MVEEAISAPEFNVRIPLANRNLWSQFGALTSTGDEWNANTASISEGTKKVTVIA
jgi:hypothetical protein